jgi:PAS domain S-box-containing protein
VLGYEADEVVGRSVETLIPPDRRGELADMRAAMLAGRAIDAQHTVRLRKDGTRVDVSITVSPLRDASGDVVGASVVGRDITRQKRAERYHAVQHSVSNVLAEAGEPGGVVPAVLEAIGRGMGWDIGEFWEHDAAAHVLRRASVWHAARVDAAEFDGRSRGLTFERGAGIPGRAWKTGRPVLVSDVRDDEHFLPTSVAVRNGLRSAVGLPVRSGSSTLGVMVFFSGELRSLDDDLVEMMRAAGTQVGHFLERRRMEQEAERLKDEFFGLVSHELRTPLTSIVGYVELLLESDELGPEERQFLEVVRRNAVRLLRLVGDLLFLTRVQAGQFAIVPGPVELSGLVAESVEASRPAADARGIDIAVEAQVVPEATGDRDRLAQLLDNLVSNAVKYAAEGGRVTVSLARDEGGAVLTVHNTGSYIPPAEQERLFERFFRAAAATRRLTPGIGLGLTIAKAIADAHGGRISVMSDRHHGTTFRVDLPLEQARDELALASEGDPHAERA